MKSIPAILAALLSWFVILPATAQNPNPAGPTTELAQRLAEVKQAAAANKQALAHYSWQQQETIAVKGNVKDTKIFEVRLGADGKPVKVEMENVPQSSRPERGVREHIKEKKTEEFKEYGEQISELARQYTQVDPEKLQQAYQAGNLMLASGGTPYEVKMIIKNYVKPNDQVTLVFDRQGKAIRSLDVRSYLSDPKDAVSIGAQFSKLPDGTNHVATMQINGVSKQLLITTENSNYQKMM